VSSELSCFLIGGDNLLLECAERLTARGHEIRGIVTATDRIAAWARKRNIPVVDAGPRGMGDGYKTALAERPFDYLFAITHLAMLPDDVVRLPRKGAINFHDGPLPRYAGLNAPAWALMNRETRYGISWHVIESGIDTGDLLEQRMFDIAPQETSLSINTRCFELGIESFDELIGKIETGTVTRTPQGTEGRSVFMRSQRPPLACFLDFTRPAEELEALVHALDFGPYANPLGSAKILVDGAPIVVTRAEAREGLGEAGVVLSTDGELVVACAKGAVALGGFATPCGTRELTPSDLGLGEGARLELPRERLERLEELNATLAKWEPFWLERLRRLDPVEIPYATAEAKAGTERAEVTVPLPGSLAGGGAGAVIAAIGAFLGRLGHKERFELAFVGRELRAKIEGLEPFVAPNVPLRIDIPRGTTFTELVTATKQEVGRVSKRVGWLRDAIVRTPELRGRRELADGPVSPIGIAEGGGPIDGTLATFVVEGATLVLSYDPARLERNSAAKLADQLVRYAGRIAAEPDRPLNQHGLLSPEERERVVREWNATAAEYPKDACVHRLFEAQVAKTPDQSAVIFEGRSLTYRELDERANKLAFRLRDLGVGPDALVGVFVDRSLDLMVATLGTQKAGGAYLPLDPAYPSDRLAFMIEDSKAKVIVTHSSLVASLPETAKRADIVLVDQLSTGTSERVDSGVTSEHLAYVIYTSGSTGKPKGVMVEHRNVANFFRGMDDVIPHDAVDGKPPVWLAVTSLSFDISVLELFWTLARGFSVVVFLDRERTGATGIDPALQNQAMGFGLFYWGNDDGQGPKKYELLLEGAKFADNHGFTSVWTPERHFHAFGGPYPNPAVTGAAVAAVTKNLDIRAGSCVLPLHHPARVAEEWAVVDNMSNGRVGLSVAAGWQPEDFLLRPENAPPANKEAMFRDVEIVRKLWRGEKVTFDGPRGPQEVLTQPRPVSKELAVWVTTAGNPDTYRGAAKAGANVLTHLLGQSIAEVAEKIVIYREALKENGRNPRDFKVTLMLHTLVGTDTEAVRATAREPMKEYLRSAVGLIKQYAWAFPAFKRPEGATSAMDVDLQTLNDEELDGILEFAFERYFEESGLFGTVDECVDRVNELKKIGVDEIACLIDYGVPTPQVLEGLRPLAEVVAQTNRKVAVGEDHSLPALVERRGVTHMQCTPSMARMLSLHDESSAALSKLRHMMVGGEAFPVALAGDLTRLMKGTVTNMYGPTETTIWSSTQRIEGAPTSIPIGRPIANTQLYVLDDDLEPVPPGVPGELYIGGDGVVRGYLFRKELTSERFVQSPFGPGRIYRTGDLARFRDDGVVEFLGRTDHQVKIRGYRIELGEIETLLNRHDSVVEGVVVAREDTPGDQRLVAYYVAKDGGGDEAETALREALREKLPEYMVPSHFVALDALPLTPNGKVDRKAMPAPESQKKKGASEYVAPDSELESKVAEVWQETLGRERVGVDDNFFDIGGHSLLVVRMHRVIKERIEQPVSLTDLYRFPTIRTFVAYLESGGKSEDLQKSADRAAMRRDAMRTRRRR
jgi:natural product biosynthesis luciferase-like monooxygenase protein